MKAKVELRMAGPDPLVLPPGVTARGPGRWIVPSKTDLATSPRLRAVLSAAWRVVAGCGP